MKSTMKNITAAIAVALLSSSASAAEYNFKSQSSYPSGDKNFQVKIQHLV